jgi:hypothetical protein
VDNCRQQDLIKEVTYPKVSTINVKSSGVRVREVRNKFTRAREIAYNKVDVIDITLPTVTRTKWVTAKAYITK